MFMSNIHESFTYLRVYFQNVRREGCCWSRYWKIKKTVRYILLPDKSRQNSLLLGIVLIKVLRPPKLFNSLSFFPSFHLILTIFCTMHIKLLHSKDGELFYPVHWRYVRGQENKGHEQKQTDWGWESAKKLKQIRSFTQHFGADRFVVGIPWCRFLSFLCLGRAMTV